MAAITKQVDWSHINSSLWTQYFANTKLAAARDSGLTMIQQYRYTNTDIPVQQYDENYQKGFMGRKDRGSEGLEESSISGYRPDKQPKKDTKWKPYPYPSRD